MSVSVFKNIAISVSVFGYRLGSNEWRRKDVQIGVVGALMGHSRSPAMSPFDRAHMTSYSTLIETMRLSCTVFEI